MAQYLDLGLTVSGTDLVPHAGISRWINLTTDDPEVALGVSRIQLAQALDNLIGIENHCSGEKTQDAYDPAGEETPEEHMREKLSGQGCQEFIEKLGASNNCSPFSRAGLGKNKKVYAHCSGDDVRGDYTLYTVGSGIIISGPIQGKAVIRYDAEFSGASFAPLHYLVDSDRMYKLWINPDYRPRWTGPVIVDGEPSSPPNVKVMTGNILLSKEVSGNLSVYIPILFDIWTVAVPGTVVGDARIYRSTVIASSPLLEDPARVDLEDETKDNASANDCSACGGYTDPFPEDFDIDDYMKTGKTGTIVEVLGPEPEDHEDEPVDWPTEIGCCDGKELEYTPYVESGFGGFSAPPEEIMEGRGENTQFIGIGPKEGPCGVRRYKQEAEDCDICGDADQLEYYEGNPDLIAPGGSVNIGVTGGLLPITWSLDGGDGYTLTGGGTSYIGGRGVEVFASLDVCGDTTINAADGCSGANGSLMHTGGIEFTVESLSLLPGRQGRVYATNGSAPYDWSTDGDVTIVAGGTPTTYYADVRLNSDACGGGSINIADDCGSDNVTINNAKLPIRFDYDSIDLLPGQQTRLYARNGMRPYDWSTDGDVTIVAGGTPATYYADVRLNSDACSGGSVNVADPCDDYTCEVVNVKPDLYLLSTEFELCEGETARAQVYNGISPFVWNVGGGLEIIQGGGGEDSYVDVVNNGGGGSVSVSDGCGESDQVEIEDADC